MARALTEGFTLTRLLPNSRPSKFTTIAVGGAFCLAAAGSVSAVTLSSYSAPSGGANAAAGLAQTTSQQNATTQSLTTAEKAAAAQAAEMKAAAAAKAAAAKAARDHSAHLAHEQHATILAARAAAAKAAAAQKAAQQKAAQQASSQASTQQAASAPSGSPQQIAQQLLDSEGEGSQFSCLDPLWQHESGWSVSASNPSSGAYGIPQALPGSKMSSAGPNWQTDAETQIKWGLQYIKDTYGSPCSAWSHEQSDGWY